MLLGDNFIIARVFSPSFFGYCHWGCVCDLSSLPFRFSSTSCSLPISEQEAAYQKPDHFTAALFPCCGPPSHSEDQGLQVNAL